MYKETINKLQNDINSNISIEELKILYGIDIEDYCNSDYLEISKYRNNRNKYEDLSKIFGNDKIATNLNDISRYTICYIGNLDYYNELSTDNIKYIFGNLSSNFDLYIYNLNSLVSVDGNASFNIVKSAHGLSSLKNISGDATFGRIQHTLGLNNLQNIGGSAYFNKLLFASDLVNLKRIGRDAYFNILESAEGLESLKYVGGNAYFPKLRSNKYLNENINPILNSYYPEKTKILFYRNNN